VVKWWRQGPELPRVLVLHDVIYSHAPAFTFSLASHSNFILTAEGH
jgi:hypothetical protein